MVIEVNFYIVIASVLWLPADQFANLGFGLTRVASFDRKIFVVWLWFFYYKFINLLSCKNVATVEKIFWVVLWSRVCCLKSVCAKLKIGCKLSSSKILQFQFMAHPKTLFNFNDVTFKICLVIFSTLFIKQQVFLLCYVNN